MDKGASVLGGLEWLSDSECMNSISYSTKSEWALLLPCAVNFIILNTKAPRMNDFTPKGMDLEDMLVWARKELWNRPC